jgi:hypothetical protein
MTFVKGQSGNPAGRPPGSRNKRTLLYEALLDGEGEGFTRWLIEKALQGDSTAMRLCSSRLIPDRRDRPTGFALPELSQPGGIPEAIDQITAGIADETLTTREALDLARYVGKAAENHKLARQLESGAEHDKEGATIIIKWPPGEGDDEKGSALVKNNE